MSATTEENFPPHGAAGLHDTLFRRLVEFSGQGIGWADLDGNIVYLNPALRRMLELDADAEASGLNLRRFYRPHDLAVVEGEMLVGVLQQGAWSGEMTLLTCRGIEVPTLHNVHLIRDEAGAAIALACDVTDLSRQKLHEQNLHRSKSKYRALVENIPQRVFYKDLQSRYLAANRRYAGDLGIHPKDIVGKDDFAFHPRLLAEKYRRDDQRVMASGETEACDEAYLRDGQERIIHTVKTPVRGDRGQVIGVCGIFLDVTEQRRLEQRLSESEFTLRAIYENAHEGIMVASIETSRLMMANPAICRMLGYSEAELLRMAPLDLHPPEALPRVRAHFRAMEQGDFSLCREMPLLRKDNSVFYADVSPTHISIQGQRCFLGVFRDVTDNCQSRQALIRSEALLAEAQTLAHLGNWNLDLVSGQASWSDEEYRLLGYSPGVVAASVENFQQAVHPDDLPGVMAEMRRAMTPGETRPYHCEHRVLLPDGERFVEQQGRVVFDEAGQPLRMYGTTLDVTEQRQTESLLRAERNFSSAVLDNAGALLLVLDREGRIRRFNRACEVLSGYTFAEVEGRSPFDLLLLPEERDRVREHVLLALDNHPEEWARKYTNYWLDKSGGKHLLEWHKAPLLDDRGHLEYLVSIGIDITEKQAVEDALRRSQETHAQAEAIAHLGSWDLDIATGVLHWTDEVFRIFGHPPQSFVATHEAFMDAVHPDDRQQVIDAVNASIADANTDYAVEHRVIRPDGEIRIVQERAKVYRDATGVPFRMVGSVHDITEQKRAEAELARHRDHLEELVRERTAELERQSRRNTVIVNMAMDGFFTAGADGRVNDCNETYCHMLGYSREELLRLHIAEIEADETPEEMAAHIGKIVEQGRDRFDTRHRCKDGSLIDVEVNVTMPHIGEDRFLFAFVHDISARKADEAALTRARDEAERANRAKSDFLSRMSHELRTPLNAILGFGQLLQHARLDEQEADNVAEILNAGQHLLGLINEVLDLARIESGKFALSLEPVSLPSLIADCLGLIRPQAEARGIRIVDASADPHDTCAVLHVRADRARLRQVLLNLLSNSIKYNADQGELRVDCRPLGDAIQIRVSDSGAGLSAEQQARLFVPFERLGADQTGIEGTGIGLALSKRLVDLMQGEIGVESAPGAGSTFWVGLPSVLAPAEAPEVASEITADAAENQLDHAAGSRQWNVLCIEDNPANLRLVERILAYRKDVRLLSASTPGLGLELARAHRPALILLDINLPGMDGFEVLRRLQAQAETRAIPVIGVSANAMPKDIERAQAAGFVDYLTKPLDVGVFLAAVDAALAQSTGKSHV